MRRAVLRDRSGMTLIEVVLALALMALLGVFIVGVLRSVLGIWQASELRGRGDLAFHAATERLQRDLDAFSNGPRGWIRLDRWRARAATEEEPAWYLPRLRFLADGAGLRGDDPSGARGVEVMWLLVPEDVVNTRLCRLVRYAVPEGDGPSLLEDSAADRLAREGGGLAVLDGVAWLDLAWEEADGSRRDEGFVPPEEPYDFPRRLEVSLDRVSGRAREKPPTLDADLGSGAVRLDLRGDAPFDFAPHVLVGREWIEVAGRFPRLTVTERAARGSAAAEHPRGAAVLMAQSASARLSLPAGGRRLQP
jgi:prepilin-type N-terminal cleavage/methylation domain-containing protein